LIVTGVAIALAFPHGNSNSICDRYSRALKITNVQLVTSVVNGTVAGLVAPHAPTKKYFDGRKPPGSVNFLTNALALNRLKNSLVNYFYGPLGCTDKPFRNYTGGTMAAVHGMMGINNDEFNFFVNTLSGVLMKAGVSSVDVSTVRKLLGSTRAAIVTATSVSICDKYSQALKVTNTQLVTSVVSGTIKLLVASTAPTKKYFDGTKPPGSKNFLDPKNAASLAALTSSLVDFFWKPLGCTMDGPRTYMGGTMSDVHSSMGINNAEMTFFKNAVAQVLTKAGVSAGDVMAVSAVVESLRAQIVKKP